MIIGLVISAAVVYGLHHGSKLTKILLYFILYYIGFIMLFLMWKGRGFEAVYILTLDVSWWIIKLIYNIAAIPFCGGELVKC